MPRELFWREDRASIQLVKRSAVVFRVSRRPHVWEPPDWAFAAEDGTFGNRFDDPDGSYRVLYASSARLGCFLETLARYRLDPQDLAAELASIAGEDDFFPLATIPRNWLSSRLIGQARPLGWFVDIGSAQTIAELRTGLCGRFEDFGIVDLDASVLQGPLREVTRAVSRFIYQLGHAGIRYLSKYGSDIENWALFEPFLLEEEQESPIDASDPELAQALQILALQFEI